MLPELEQANETVVEAYVIDVALRRGRHGRMAILRCLTRAQEIGDELPPDQRRDYHDQDVVEYAMQYFGKKRRSIQHYLKVLAAPREVQDALDRDELDLKTAKAVAKLGSAVQAMIAQAVREGENARCRSPVHRSQLGPTQGDPQRPQRRPEGAGAHPRGPRGPGRADHLGHAAAVPDPVGGPRIDLASAQLGQGRRRDGMERQPAGADVGTGGSNHGRVASWTAYRVGFAQQPRPAQKRGPLHKKPIKPSYRSGGLY